MKRPKALVINYDGTTVPCESNQQALNVFNAMVDLNKDNGLNVNVKLIFSDMSTVNSYCNCHAEPSVYLNWYNTEEAIG